MKYTKPILVSIIAIIPLSIMFGVLANAGWVILLFPTSAILGALMGFILAPAFLWGYKKTVGRKHRFIIQQYTEKKSYGMLKGFFPGLMATNLALFLIFDPIIMTNPLFQDYYLQWNGIIFLFFNIGALLGAPAFALFHAAWIITDSGIIATKQTGSMTGFFEFQNVGKLFLSFLEGYAGIGVIIALYQFTFEFLGTYGSAVHFSAVIFLFILPFIVTLWVIPAVLVVDASSERGRRYIVNFANRIGISSEFESTDNTDTQLSETI